MKSRSLKSHYYRTAVPTVLALMMWSGSALAQERSFNLPADDAGHAIQEFARQAGIEIMAPADKLKNLRLPAIQGTYDVHEALKILLTGTGLTIASDDGKFITLSNQPAPGLKKISSANPVQVAQNAPQQAQAARPAQAAEQPSSVEEIVVTGSRIVREGYEAPTPLTVVSADAIAQSAQNNLLNVLATMPAVTGARSSATSTNTLSSTGAGVNSLNLRSLGPNRVLVLMDGQRVVASTYGNFVDVNTIPSQLVARVDVVTGGASAVYGSDAVGGVVNFILDKKFTGVKGELSGGVTNYGDDKTYKIQMSAGFGFADDRGHVLLSGEQMQTGGIKGDGGRMWARRGEEQISNPAYSATNGQPQFLFVNQAALATASAGGLIVAGPLKGTAFGAGGVPYKFNYGSIVSGSIMQGGDWQANDIRKYSDIDPKQANQNLFTRVSYDITDGLTAYGQWSFSQNRSQLNLWQAWMPGSATLYTIQSDNAFLPASTRAALLAAGQTQFGIGSWNADMPETNYLARRMTNRVNGGLEGKFDAFGSGWNWNANYSYGATKLTLSNTSPSSARYRLATDAVVNPANGQIVCRSVLQGANNGCLPWNAMGIGVNTGNLASFNWMTGGGALQHGLIQETSMSASVTGEPFSVWAGPVSLAISVEHRNDKINADVDAVSLSATRITGNFSPLHGQQSVTEGALETIVPLAKDESWAKSWDLSAAARFTGYSLAGYATTWKVGTTYAPIDDIKFRVTQSRDLRAPNLQDLFQSPTVGVNTSIIDRFLPGQPLVPANTLQSVSGNPNLTPEKADTTGVGVVLAPRFLPGFTMSADYWKVGIKSAILQLSPQVVVDQCYSGAIPALCPNIIRKADGTISQVNVSPINLAIQDVRGLDLEASYRTALSDIISAFDGNFSLHGVMTFYFKNYQDTKLSFPTDTAGENTSSGPPNWKYTVTATYQLNAVSTSLTARGLSSGVINNTYIQCTSGCPTATAANPTINNNQVAGAFYIDANINYKLDLGDSVQSELFVSATNLFNKGVPTMPSNFYSIIGTGIGPYDLYGTQYRAGIRFKM